MLVWWRGLPFSRQMVPAGLWVGRCLSKHSLNHHQLCLAVGVSLQYGKLSSCLPPTPRNEHLTAEEAGCKCSHNRCCEKWHSSHKQPLKMLCEPHARASPTTLSCTAMAEEGFADQVMLARFYSILTDVGKDKNGLLCLKLMSRQN